MTIGRRSPFEEAVERVPPAERLPWMGWASWVAALVTEGTPAVMPLVSIPTMLGIHLSASAAGPNGGGEWKPRMPVIVEATFEAAFPTAPSMELMPSISDWMRFIPNWTIRPARLLKKPPMFAPRLLRMPEMRPHTALKTATTLSQAD